LRSELRLSDLRGDGLRVALDEQLGGLSDPFTEYVGQVALAFAAIVDRFEERGWGIVFRWGDGRRIQESTESIEFCGRPAGIEPLVLVPFDECFVAQASKKNTVLLAIGDQGQGMIRFAHPLEGLADRPRTSTDADSLFFVDEDG